MSDIAAEDIMSPSKVRELIFAYERQSSALDVPEEHYIGRQRTRSIGNILSYKQFRQPNLEIHSLGDIEKELIKIDAHLNYYEVYEKETHVAFQEQMFNVLTVIGSIDPEGHESAIQKKKELIGETKKLAKILNSKLPFKGVQGYRSMKKNYANLVRKEEAVVSTTSIRNKDQKTVSSFINGGFKSEESLNSTRDSVDFSVSSRVDDVSPVQFNKIEDRPETATPPLENKVVNDIGYLPSVSRLKKFFSFRKDEKDNLKLTPASYSGISRSQSLNLKNANCTAAKKEAIERQSMKEDSIVEDQEDDKNLSFNGGSNVVEIKEVETSRESNVHTTNIGEGKKTHVSVSKLKNLFERKQKESNEGLELLTKKQAHFRSSFNLPYTEANLGAFRLKRTLSGNYMNFTGLLHNVDIRKKADMSKSKSLSDLKSESFRYSFKDIDIDEDDLSKELDGDDEDTFEHASTDLENEKEDESIAIVEPKASSIETPQSASLTFGKVELLKKSFENLNKSNAIESQNEGIQHLLHQTFEPTSFSDDKVEEEPILRVPVQLRNGANQISSFNENQHIITENRNDNSKAGGKPEISTYQVEDVKDVALYSAVAADNVISGTGDVEKQTYDVSNSEDTSFATLNAEPAHIATASVEGLKRTFESLNKRNSGDNYHEAKIPILKVVEPSDSTSESSEEVSCKADPQDVGADFSQDKFHNEEISYGILSPSPKELRSEEVKLEPIFLKAPEHPIIENDAAIYVTGNIAKEDSSPAVPITLHNGTLEDGNENTKKTLDKEHIETKMQSPMEILETPVGYSTLSSVPSTVRAEDNEGLEKEDVHFHLSTSQENILEEILNGEEALCNVDEEFEKLMQNN
ncbi:uncharacterized protein [Euwallacea fornicatus]|uniref:uncharacterized protein isoform X2 n=1 Tax=Euwallacea fornicatus TaxID=995702 RepID=UPI0033903914